MNKKSIIALLVSFVLLGVGIFLTYVFVKSGTWIVIPFIWILILAGWAEAINIIVHDYK